MPFEGHLSNGRSCAILGLCDMRSLARTEIIGVSRGNLSDPRSVVRSELSCAVEVTGAIRSHCHFSCCKSDRNQDDSTLFGETFC